MIIFDHISQNIQKIEVLDAFVNSFTSKIIFTHDPRKSFFKGTANATAKAVSFVITPLLTKIAFEARAVDIFIKKFVVHIMIKGNPADGFKNACIYFTAEVVLSLSKKNLVNFKIIEKINSLPFLNIISYDWIPEFLDAFKNGFIVKASIKDGLIYGGAKVISLIFLKIVVNKQKDERLACKIMGSFVANFTIEMASTKNAEKSTLHGALKATVIFTKEIYRSKSTLIKNTLF